MSTVSMFTEVFPTVDHVLNIVSLLLAFAEQTGEDFAFTAETNYYFQIRLIVCVISFIN